MIVHFLRKGKKKKDCAFGVRSKKCLPKKSQEISSVFFFPRSTIVLDFTFMSIIYFC